MNANDWRAKARAAAIAKAEDLALPSGMVIRGIQVDGMPLAVGQRVKLDGAHALTLEIASGETHARVSGTEGRFQSTLATGEGP